jgi:hypothetical protein
MAEDAEDLSHIKTTVENGVLVIDREGRIKNDVTIKANLKSLERLDLSGACEAGTLNQVSATNLMMDLTGASVAKLDLNAESVTARISGASETRLTGKGKNLDVSVSGASEFKGYEFEAETAKIVASGASTAHVNARSLDADASGTSDIRYEGSPTITRSASSGSSEISSRNGSSSSKSDTTHLSLGKKNYTIIDGELHNEDGEKEKKTGGEFKFWNGVNLNVNGYLNSSNKTDLPNGFEFLELNYAKSIGLDLNMFQKNIPIYHNYVQLFTGLGFGFNSYAFRNNITLRTDTNYVAATYDTINYRADKLKTVFVQVPLMLEFNTNANEDESFHIAGGLTFGYNIFDNRLKQKFTDDGSKRKRVIRDDYNINPVRMNMSAMIGYGDFTLHADYSLTSLFEKGKGPVLYPFSAGIGLAF